MNDMTIGAAQDAPQAGGIVFTGRDDEFRDILRKGALLEVVTFGFYRFWLATKIRQHLWSHTILDGDAFAYLGTARELLIGFFFAIAILAPIYLASFLLGVEAERSQAFASTLIGVFFPGVLAVRDLSGAALSPASHRLARRVLPSRRLGRDIFFARHVVGPSHIRHARSGAALHAGGAGAL